LGTKKAIHQSKKTNAKQVFLHGKKVVMDCATCLD
jgi:hypothetical protein